MISNWFLVVSFCRSSRKLGIFPSNRSQSNNDTTLWSIFQYSEEYSDVDVVGNVLLSVHLDIIVPLIAVSYNLFLTNSKKIIVTGIRIPGALQFDESSKSFILVSKNQSLIFLFVWSLDILLDLTDLFLQ